MCNAIAPGFYQATEDHTFYVARDGRAWCVKSIDTVDTPHPLGFLPADVRRCDDEMAESERSYYVGLIESGTDGEPAWSKGLDDGRVAKVFRDDEGGLRLEIPGRGPSRVLPVPFPLRPAMGEFTHVVGHLPLTAAEAEDFAREFHAEADARERAAR